MGVSSHSYSGLDGAEMEVVVGKYVVAFPSDK